MYEQRHLHARLGASEASARRPRLGTRLVGRIDRALARLDRPEEDAGPGAVRVRRALAFLIGGYALLLAARKLWHSELPTAGQLFVFMLATALYANRGGRFLRDWGLVVAGISAYGLAGGFAEQLDFKVHYTPQIDADKVIGFGTVPTLWLQEHLYSGRTGPLEIFSTALYLSHFFVPLVLGFYLWWRLRKAFTELMFGLLAVSILAEITFVLAPTAPPWLAAEDGLLPPVHHIIKLGLSDLGLGAVAALDGDPARYNIVAAVPSLHAAFPVICLAVMLAYRLPRWAIALESFHVAGVFFAIVYTGEHYVFDAFAGSVYAVVAWSLVHRALRQPVRTAHVPVPVPQPASVPSPLAEPAV